jgi:cyclopropane fatty-acyl-phospholipid synthase-like methyltransferase
MSNTLFDALQNVSTKPAPYSVYNSPDFWNDPYISKRLLNIHLNPEMDMFTRNSNTLSNEMKWINDRFKIGNGLRICDFGCGPGLYTSQWAKAGAQVTGIDVSEQSIAYAKEHADKEGVKVEYLCEDYLHYSTTKKFDLITMIYCIFCELNPGQRKDLLKKFHSLLDDDGAVLLDVYSLKVFEQKEEKEASFASSSYPCSMSNFWSPEYHYLFTSYFKYDDECLSLDKYSVVEPKSVREVYIWLQYFSLQSLKAEFEASGFKIVEHYSDLTGKEYQPDSETIAVVAKKA